jgi:hypothetical protein
MIGMYIVSTSNGIKLNQVPAEVLVSFRSSLSPSEDNEARVTSS